MPMAEVAGANEGRDEKDKKKHIHTIKKYLKKYLFGERMRLSS